MIKLLLVSEADVKHSRKLFEIFPDLRIAPSGSAKVPRPVLHLSYLNPCATLWRPCEDIVMKRASIGVLYPEVVAMIIFGLAIFTFSWLRFSKRGK